MKKNKRYIIFIVIIWVILVAPFAGMVAWPTNETIENKELVELPTLFAEGEWNTRYLLELGEYFEDHFAFRQHFVTANASIRSKLFKSPTTKEVVVGSERWLYFGGSLNDYRGKNVLSERELFNIVHNLSLIQSYVEQNGGRFWLMIAPNKNSLYQDNMPYYYQPGEETNMEKLTEMLRAQGVNYVDLFEAFRSTEEVLYFERDSHWNNKGAVLVSNTLMSAMGKEHETYLNVPFTIQKNHIGDLEKMQYPLAVELEENYVYATESKFYYNNEVEDNMDSWIETVNPDKQGTLLMYRDSFGESMIPFLANEIERGYFSRLQPYHLTQVEQLNPKDVVIEKVERNIQEFASEIPIMEGPLVEHVIALEAETKSTIAVSAEGSYLMVKGEIDAKYMSDDTMITVAIRDQETYETKTYEAFYTVTDTGNGNGYQLYLKGGSVPDGHIKINIQVTSQGESVIVIGEEIEWEKVRN